MTCPEGSFLNENKMCIMPPKMTCPAGYTLVNGMCQLDSGAAAPQVAPAAPEPPAAVPPQTQPQPVAPAPAGMEPQCPSGYEYRDSMCYPLTN